MAKSSLPHLLVSTAILFAPCSICGPCSVHGFDGPQHLTRCSKRSIRQVNQDSLSNPMKNSDDPLNSMLIKYHSGIESEIKSAIVKQFRKGGFLDTPATCPSAKIGDDFLPILKDVTDSKGPFPAFSYPSNGRVAAWDRGAYLHQVKVELEYWILTDLANRMSGVRDGYLFHPEFGEICAYSSFERDSVRLEIMTPFHVRHLSTLDDTVFRDLTITIPYRLPKIFNLLAENLSKKISFKKNPCLYLNTIKDGGLILRYLTRE